MILTKEFSQKHDGEYASWYQNEAIQKLDDNPHELYEITGLGPCSICLALSKECLMICGGNMYRWIAKS